MADSLKPMLEQYFALIDGGKLSEACEMFTDDAKLTFANAEPVYGADAAQKAIQMVLDQTSSIKHEIVSFWDVDEEGYGQEKGGQTAVFELRIVYNLTSGKAVRNPGVSVAVVRDGKFIEQRLYGDLNNVFAG